jgi:hypothetical protein
MERDPKSVMKTVLLCRYDLQAQRPMKPIAASYRYLVEK